MMEGRDILRETKIQSLDLMCGLHGTQFGHTVTVSGGGAWVAVTRMQSGWNPDIHLVHVTVTSKNIHDLKVFKLT